MNNQELGNMLLELEDRFEDFQLSSDRLYTQLVNSPDKINLDSFQQDLAELLAVLHYTSQKLGLDEAKVARDTRVRLIQMKGGENEKG